MVSDISVRKSVDSINFVIIQATNLCNLNCNYCYLDGRKTPGKISFETLDVTFKKLSESPLIETPLRVNWHAGEPLVAGIDFYKEAFKIARKYFPKGKVNHLFQTNGTLINNEWAEFFVEENVGIGVSCDGPPFLQDQQRVNWAGKGSSKLLQNGLDILNAHNIHISGICVLTKHNIDHPNEIYDYFLENKFNYIGFALEEVEAINKATSFKNMTEETVKHKYRSFLKTFFSRMKQDGYKLRCRELSYWGSTINEKSKDPDFVIPKTFFGISTLSISKEGNICAFAPELMSGTPDNKTKFVVGNVHDDNSLEDVQKDERYRHQLDDIIKGVHKCKASCEYFDLCGGLFVSNKFYENGSFNSSETQHCNYFVKGTVDGVLDWVEKEHSLKT